MNRNVSIEYLHLFGEELTDIINTLRILNTEVMETGHVELRRFIIKSTFITKCMDEIMIIYETSNFFNNTLRNHYNRFRAEFMQFMFTVIRQNSNEQQIDNIVLIRFMQRTSAIRHMVLNEIHRLS